MVPGGKAWMREGEHIHRGADAGERGSVAEEWREGYEARFGDIGNTGARHEQSTRGKIGDEAVLDLLAQIRDEPESVDERQSLWLRWGSTRPRWRTFRQRWSRRCGTSTTLIIPRRKPTNPWALCVVVCPRW